jgi:hypothetical protein
MRTSDTYPSHLTEESLTVVFTMLPIAYADKERAAA